MSVANPIEKNKGRTKTYWGILFTIEIADTKVNTSVPVNDDHNVNNNFCDSE